MLTKKVTKLWKGEYLSIRTYEHQAAIKADGLKLIYEDKSMTLSRQQLENLRSMYSFIASSIVPS